MSDNAGVRLPPPLYFLAAIVLGPVIDWLGGIDSIPIAMPLRAVLAIAIVAAGLALPLSAIRLFNDAGTNVEPWKEVKALVTDGPYRFSRNPMYVGLTLIAVGMGLLFASPSGIVLAIVAALLIDRFVIAREEAYLTRLFGEDYAAYKRRVRRWL